MNNKKIRKYQIISTIFTFILGTLLHFTYKISGENPIVAIFSATNESVFEHLKLVFFPMLITTIIGYFYLGKEYKNFLCAKTFGIIVSIAFMITFFYTYTGIIGTNIAFIDITSFFISVLIGEIISYLLIVNNFKCNNKLAIAILLILVFSFIFFTFNTPDFGIFKDPTLKN